MYRYCLSLNFFRVQLLMFLSQFLSLYTYLLGHICPFICPWNIVRWSRCLLDVMTHLSFLQFLECKHYGCGFLGITGQLLIGITASYWGPRLLPSIPPSGTGTSQMGPTSDVIYVLKGFICAYKQIHADFNESA